MAAREDFDKERQMHSRYEQVDQRLDTNGRDPAALRGDIERTRGRMSDTLDQIGERLNVNRIKAEVRDTVREQVQETKEKVRAATIGRAQIMARNAADGANDARHSIMHTIRENPIPAAMVGIGLGWLMMGGRRERNSTEHRQNHLRTDFAGGAAIGANSDNQYFAGGYYADQQTYHATANDTGFTEDQGRVDRAREKAADLGHTVRDRASDVAESTRHVAKDVRERAHHMAEDVRERARHVGERTQRVAHRTRDTIDDNPVAMGAVALAVGLAAGMTIPTSRRESELMGPARDRVVDRARGYVDETREKVQRVASEVADDARIAARDAVAEVRESAREAAREEGLMGDSSSDSEGMRASTARDADSGIGGMSADSGSPHSSSTGGMSEGGTADTGAQLGRTSGIRPEVKDSRSSTSGGLGSTGSGSSFGDPSL